MRQFMLQEFAGIVMYGPQALVLYFMVRKTAIFYAAKQVEKKISQIGGAVAGGFDRVRNERAG